MVEDGVVTEGSSSTVFIVTQAGALVTRPLSNAILPGITRKAVLALAQETGRPFEERLINVRELSEAAEAFYTSASAFVMPVVELDGKALGDGRPGPVARRLRELYFAVAEGAGR